MISSDAAASVPDSVASSSARDPEPLSAGPGGGDSSTGYTTGVVFAKVLLVVVILLTIALALTLRVRAWKLQRERRRAQWQADLDRDLRE